MVSALDDSSIKIGARAWCRSGDYWAVYNGAVEAVNNAFVAGGISQPFPQVDVHMKN